MVYIISELCGQWGGSVRRAEQMILQSKLAGADAVKVQLYDTYRMPGKNRQRWDYLSMKKDDFIRLKTYAESLNIDFFASAFHKDRFEWIKNQNIKINKIASSLVKTDYNLCKEMLDTGILTYCSLGHWDDKDYPFNIEKYNNIKYFHCISKYPHSFECALDEMPKSFDNTLVGYSDHTIGINACIEAVRRGATVIEKHFTVDHNLQKDTESAHICSMNQKELETLRNVCERMK